MTTTAEHARRLVERTGTHPVISLYLDLDPTRFATPPARATQVRSLLDEARRLSEPLALDHDGRVTLEADLGRVEAELGSDELPVSGARGLAVFCSGADDVYETVALTVPTASEVFVAPVAHVEPLVTAPNLGRWCAAVVSSNDAELLEGDGATIIARGGSSTYVRGDNQSGDAQTHAREQDIEDHLLKVVAELEGRLHRDRFELLAVAGPVEIVSRLQSLLRDDLSAVLAGRLALDPSVASDVDVVLAIEEMAGERRAAARTDALDTLRSRLAGRERVAASIEEVQRALVERRVATLFLSRDFGDADNRREAVVQTALLQDAEVLAFTEPLAELPSTRPIAALLRF